MFDLDDTLYAPTPELAAIYDARMRAFIERALGVPHDRAARIQDDLYQRFGATVRGLMTEHGVAPDDYLAYVHDIDHSLIAPDPGLAAAIATLPGRRSILTNSPRRHAERVAERLGIAPLIDDIFDFARSGHHAKPAREVYDRLIAATGAAPERTAMFEDLARNLAEPRRLGMVTVLVVPPRSRELFRGAWDLERGPEAPADFVTENLSGFLAAVAGAIRSVD